MSTYYIMHSIQTLDRMTEVPVRAPLNGQGVPALTTMAIFSSKTQTAQLRQSKMVVKGFDNSGGLPYTER